MKAAYITLGCKVNQYDTAAMRELMEAAGFETVCAGADVVIINTCTVTNVADRKSRQMITHSRKQSPGAAVIVCGCLAQRSARELLSLPGVSAAVGTENRLSIAAIALRAAAGETEIDATGEARGFEPLKLSHATERIRAHIKIEEGCENFCSYCIIPYARGPVRSRGFEEIMQEARLLSAEGVRELVLTGIHICSYGRDGGDKKLIDVIEGVCSLPVRVRLGSLEPSMIDEDFVRRAALLKNLCPQFHLSLQSGADSVLLRMNRKYDTQRYAAVVSMLRGAFDTPAMTTDVIAGFPAETEAEHAQTLGFLRGTGFARIHTFIYSEREGTPAANMPGAVAPEIRKRRAGEISALAEKMRAEFIASQAKKPQTVLLETQTKEGFCEGYTEKYIRAEAKGAPGELVRL